MIYFGIVEDRQDPLKLGRLRVRICGVHTDNLSELPTQDLPWSTPIQHITSAASSGIGHSATGAIEGTMVAIMFADENKQIPIIIGTIAGIPTKDNTPSQVEEFDSIRDELKLIPPEIPPENLVKLPDGSVKPTSEITSIPSGSTVIEPGYIGTLTKTNVQKLKDVIGRRESNNDYSKENTLGFLGKYQFGATFLEDMGYIVPGTWKRVKVNKTIVDNQSSWTGKDGIVNKSTFLNNIELQEGLMDRMLKRNYTLLCKFGSLSPESPQEKTAGALCAAHLMGAGGARDYINKGVDSQDAYGSSCSSYYNLGYSAITGNQTTEAPTSENITKEAIDKDESNTLTSNLKYHIKPNKKTQSKQGFRDPNGVYPLDSHIDEPDTPRLASVIKINETIVSQKESELEKNIPISNSSVTWNQSPIPYNAKYPFNHVIETQSGHVIEIDDTEGAERINVHHKSGTFIEIDSDGNIVEKVKGTKTIIVESDSLVYMKGSGHVAIDGDLSIRIARDAQIEVLGNANIKTHGDVNHEVLGSYNLNVQGSFNINANGINVNSASSMVLNSVGATVLTAGTYNITAGNWSIETDVDSGHDYVWGTVSTGSGTPVSIGSLSSYSPVIKEPSPVTRQDSMAFVLEETDEGKTLAASIPSKPIELQSIDNIPAVMGTHVTGVCGFTQLSYDTDLTTNYKIKDLCKDGSFTFNGQNGLTGEEIACNMKQLCLNVIEPLRERYSHLGFKINSCFRPRKNGTSQHEFGCAVDIGFSKIRGLSNDREEYFRIAKEIKDSGLVFDQLLLEYRNGGSVWIHISFSLNQMRGVVLTVNNDNTYCEGLALLT